MVDKTPEILCEPECSYGAYPDGRIDTLDDVFLAHTAISKDMCIMDWWLLNKGFRHFVRAFEDWRKMREELHIRRTEGTVRMKMVTRRPWVNIKKGN